MFVAQHFDQGREAGFLHRVDAQSARRQFQVSLALILVLAIAAVALGLLARVDRASMFTMSHWPMTVGSRVAEMPLDIRS
ncbi:hypothetical protein [Methylocapsa acidiphila]|uniref:hypothetical protein n=1 Tax=Methylocapsa acidiphila TaxID=133552 RepID=UPI000561D9F7|nr:hypothetical protein [Methylocapsa acidiphila]